jgi:transposase
MAADQKKARRQNATLIFVDESGFSLIPTRVRTWAPRGKTPIVMHCYRWPKFSAISGVTTDRRLFLMVRKGTIATSQVIVFLRHLLRHVRRRIVLVWDNLNTHKSGAVRAFVAAHQERIHIEYLPAYAPELNPDEGVWRYLKHVELGNFAPRNLAELKNALRRSVKKIQRKPDLIVGFIKQTALFF